MEEATTPTCSEVGPPEQEEPEVPAKAASSPVEVPARKAAAVAGGHSCAEPPQVLKMLDDTAADLSLCRRSLAQLAEEVESLRTEKQVLTEMHERYLALSEQSFERNALYPVLHGLIGIADRCRQGVAGLRRTLERHADNQGWKASATVCHILEARSADLTEIENLLANLGVESFQHPEEQFHPELQKCVERRESSDRVLHSKIAERLRPGYRRGDTIVRREFVSVYVFDGTHQQGAGT